MFIIILLLAILSFFLSVRSGIHWKEAVLAIVFLFPMPLSEIIGGHLPLFFADFSFFFVWLFYSQYQKSQFIQRDRIVIIGFFLFVLLPVLCTIYSQIFYTPPDIRHYLYIYRRIALFVLILLANKFGGLISVRNLFNSAAVFWLLISCVGLLHYSGTLLLPSYIEEVDDSNVQGSVFDNYHLVRGFLSFNRGALGLYGATFIVFSFGSLMTKNVDRHKVFYYTVYILVIITSILNIIFSGTRTGVFVSAFVLVFLYVKVSLVSKKLNLATLVMFFLIGALGVFALTNISNDRFSKMDSDDSLESRFIVQEAVLDTSLEDPFTFVFGNGIRPFNKVNVLGFTHPHSEYFEILYLTGWPSLILYLLLIYSLYDVFKRKEGVENSIYIAVLLNGCIFGLVIGHFLIYGPRLSSYGSFIFFIYCLYCYEPRSKVSFINNIGKS